MLFHFCKKAQKKMNKQTKKIYLEECRKFVCSQNFSIKVSYKGSGQKNNTKIVKTIFGTTVMNGFMFIIYNFMPCKIISHSQYVSMNFMGDNPNYSSEIKHIYLC